MAARHMEYRSLGRSGLKVSPLCLGAMMFGGATDEATSRRIVERARPSWPTRPAAGRTAPAYPIEGRVARG